MGTEDVGVLEVDGFVLERVGGVDERFSLAVELDRVGGFVDAISLDDRRFPINLLGQHADVLLVHVLDVAD
jgi:hypothetical protein